MIDPNRTCGTCALYSESARPGEAKTPSRGGWCLAPVPAWARVAMDDARTLPTRGARCPVWAAKPSAVDPRQTSLIPEVTR